MCNQSSHLRIDLIGDLALPSAEEIFLVENDPDYVRVCRVVADHFSTDGALSIRVRKKNHFVWLCNFVEQIGLAYTAGEKTGCDVLAEEWKVSLPDWLDDKTVLDEKLLNLPIEAHLPGTFQNRFLAHFFGAAIQDGSLDAGNVSEIISTLTTEKASKLFERYSSLERCLQEKCDEWQTQSADKWAKAIAVRLPEKLRHVWKCLSSWALLHTYPQELLEYVLAAQDVMWVASVPAASVAGIPVEPETRDEAITQIDLFFNKVTPQVETREDFLKVLGFVSGRLLLEFKHIQELIKSGQFKATMEDVRKVKEIFKQCPGVTASRLKMLEHCVMPVRPRLLAEGIEWSACDWIAWTTQEYIPYRAWQVYNRHYDEELENTVKRFSDWYLQEYTAIQQDMELSLVHSLSGIQVAGHDNKFILILVLDGLSVQFMGLVDHALRNCGFSLHGSQYRYAPLPTITERNKGLVLSGAWDYSEKNYESILKARAKSDWGNKSVLYLSSLKGVADLQFQLEPAIVVLNSIDSDELLHEDLEAKNTTHEEELQRLFDRLAETVEQLAGAWTGKKEDFYVYVVTDHGACRILDEEKYTLDAGVISNLFADEKYRFAEMSKQQASEVPENLWALGHKFQQPFIAENKIYFIPRGHNTVRLPGKKSVFVHGGAAPEEVIVPNYLYKPVKVAWKKPAARFLQIELDHKSGKAKFYVQRIVPLEIEIQNPNSAELQVLRVSVVTPDTEIKGYQLPVVAPLATGVLQLDCYFKKAALNESSLEIEIVYDIAGGTHTANVAVASEFKSAMTTGFSLKDL